MLTFRSKKVAATLLKRDSTQVFSCEILEIFKNTFFHRTPPVSASGVYVQGLLLNSCHKPAVKSMSCSHIRIKSYRPNESILSFSV